MDLHQVSKLRRVPSFYLVNGNIVFLIFLIASCSLIHFVIQPSTTHREVFKKKSKVYKTPPKSLEVRIVAYVYTMYVCHMLHCDMTKRLKVVQL